jgi:hypothetical protein
VRLVFQSRIFLGCLLREQPAQLVVVENFGLLACHLISMAVSESATMVEHGFIRNTTGDL